MLTESDRAQVTVLTSGRTVIDTMGNGWKINNTDLECLFGVLELNTLECLRII